MSTRRCWGGAHANYKYDIKMLTINYRLLYCF